MKRVLIWLWNYWYVPLILAGAVLGWVILRRKTVPWDDVRNELDAIKAGARAQEAAARLGAAAAVDQVKAEHAAAIARLDADQGAQAERLKDDPVALSKFLVRAGRR